NKLAASHTARPRHNRRLRYASMPQQRRLDLPKLNAKTAHLNLLVRPTHKLQNSIPTPARQVPAAVHPTTRSSKPIRNKALRCQCPTTQIAPRNARSRNVKLPNNPNTNRHKTTTKTEPASHQNRPPKRRHTGARQCLTHQRADGRPRRPVGIDHPPAL